MDIIAATQMGVQSIGIGRSWEWVLLEFYRIHRQRWPKDDALGTRLELDFVKNLAGKGHHVYFDNYYTSPTL